MLRRAANERLQKINSAALWGEASEMECRLFADEVIEWRCHSLRRMSPLFAQNGHARSFREGPLLRVART
jgi:hypothetical protein